MNTTEKNTKNEQKSKKLLTGLKPPKYSNLFLFAGLLSVCLIPLIYFFANIFVKTTIPNTTIYMSVFLIAFGLFCAPLIFYEKTAFSGFKLKNKSKLAIALFALLIAFLVWGLISVFFAKDASLALFDIPGRNEGYIMYLCYAIIFTGAVLFKDKNLKSIILSIFLSIMLGFCVFWFIDFAFFGHAKSFMGFNFTLPWANLNHSGYMIAMATVMAAALYIFENRKNYKILGLVCFCVFLITMFFNNSLGCEVAIFVTLIFLTIVAIIKEKQNYKATLIIWATFMVILAADITLNHTLHLHYQTFVDGVVNIFKDIFKIARDATSAEAEAAGTNRWRLWMECFNNIASYPFFGIGINCQLRANPHLEASRPHNEPLQFASTMGLPAGLFYLSALILIVIMLFKQLKKLNTETLVCLMGAVAYFVSSLFGVSIPYTFSIYILFLGLGVGGLNFNKKQEEIFEETENTSVGNSEVIENKTEEDIESEKAELLKQIEELENNAKEKILKPKLKNKKTNNL